MPYMDCFCDNICKLLDSGVEKEYEGDGSEFSGGLFMLMVLETLPKDRKYVVVNPRDEIRRDSRPEWFDDPRVVDIVRTIDKTEHIIGNVFESPYLGTITYRELSGGSQATILALMGTKPYIFPMSKFGDNCLPVLSKYCGLDKMVMFFDNCLPQFENGVPTFYFPNGRCARNTIEYIACRCDNGYDEDIYL